jgi:hypothetical protein
MNIKGIYIYIYIYIYSRDSSNAVTKAFCIKYCKIRKKKVIREAKKQHCNRLIAKSDNETKTTLTIIKQTREIIIIIIIEQMPSLLINDEKLKIQKRLLIFLSFFLLIAENLDLHQVGKEGPISSLKDAFPCKFHGIKIVPTSESEIKI